MVEKDTANHIVGADGVAAVVHCDLDEPGITGAALFRPCFTTFRIDSQPLLGDDSFQFQFQWGAFIPFRSDACRCVRIEFLIECVYIGCRFVGVFKIFTDAAGIPLCERDGDALLIAVFYILGRVIPQGCFCTQEPYFGSTHDDDFTAGCDGGLRVGGVAVVGYACSLADAFVFTFDAV